MPRISCFQLITIFIVFAILWELISRYRNEIALAAIIIFILILIKSAVQLDKKVRNRKIDKQVALLDTNFEDLPDFEKETENDEAISVDIINEELFHFEQKVEISKVVPLLSSSTQGYLYDILCDIKTIKQKSLDERQHSVHKISNPAILDEQFQFAILYDICQISMLLKIDMYKQSNERNILISAFGFFRLSSNEYKNLITYQNNIESIVEEFISIMITPHSYKSDEKILGAYLLKNHRRAYLLKINELVALISTIDYKLTISEKKVIDFYRNYI